MRTSAQYLEPAYVKTSSIWNIPKSYKRTCSLRKWPIIFYRIMTRYAYVEMDLILVPGHQDITHSQEWEQSAIDLFESVGIVKRYQFTTGTYMHTSKCPIDQAETLARGMLELYRKFFQWETQEV